jgi:hypothetical protein
MLSRRRSSLPLAAPGPFAVSNTARGGLRHGIVATSMALHFGHPAIAIRGAHLLPPQQS